MKKIASIMLFMIVFTTIPFLNFVVAAGITPTVSIYPPNSGVVEVGGTVSYRVVATNATSFSISASDVGLARGVTANISVQNVNSKEKIIVLSNIQGNVGASGYIAIKAGVAKNGGVSSKTTPASPAFTIIESQVVTPAPETPSEPTPAPSETPNYNNENNNNNNNNNNNGNESNEPVEEPKEEKPEEKDTESPKISITKASPESTQVGGEIAFSVDYTDNVGVESITLNEKDITLYGFTATVKVTGDGNTRKITLSNIKGDLGGLKYIKIAKGTAIDKAGNKISDSTKSGYFKLVDDTTSSKPDDWIQNPNTGR